MKLQSKSSGQVIVLLIIVLGLIGAGFWWLSSNKRAMAAEGKQFATEAIRRIVLQHDMNFFASHLSPAAKQQFPPSVQQELFSEIERLGPPMGAIDVQGEIEFQSQFFEPHGTFRARINYPARYADITITVSHPVGRWQIDDAFFLPQSAR
jgi:hypothetical protein